MTPTPVSFEHLRYSLGVGVDRPRLSWSLPPGAGAQTGYEVELDRVSRSGRIDGPAQVLVPWPGAPLVSRERVGVRVRVWTGGADPSAWSPRRVVEAGLLSPADWRAVPVGGAWPEEQDADRRPARVRRHFTLDRPVVRAASTSPPTACTRRRSTAAGSRPQPVAGVDGLPAPAALPHSRRHRPPRDGCEHDRRLAR